MAKNYDIAVLIDFYGEMLTAKQRDFLEYYYNEVFYTINRWNSYHLLDKKEVQNDQ